MLVGDKGCSFQISTCDMIFVTSRLSRSSILYQPLYSPPRFHYPNTNLTNKSMTPKIDPAILKALSLDASNTTIAKHGGSGFASTYKLTSIVDGKEKLF